MLTTRCEQRLADVDQRLAAVVRDAALRCPRKFIVTEGRRTKERQAELYAQGRTAPGKVVTWTLNSKHIDGLAVDLAPISPDGSIPWNDSKAFDAIAKAMFEAANVMEVRLKWGKNWDGDDRPGEKGETDSPHFELA